jgi:ribose transport system permease protein
MSGKLLEIHQENGIRHAIRRIFEIREIVILLLVILLSVFMAFQSKQFLTNSNFRVVGNYMATDMIIGAFLTISLIAGNTDFSVGSNMGCSDSSAAFC